jgi:hypothetical protein
MSATDVYCELCELPKSQCVHGLPATPKPVAASPPKPVKRAASKPRTAGTPAKPVTLRWTQPEALKPLILAVLRDAGGELEADDLFLELEVAADETLLPGDRETTPSGELRWHYAARRARMALIDEGLMSKGVPGRWTLTAAGHDLG